MMAGYGPSTTCEECLRVNIWALAKGGLFSTGSRLTYSRGGKVIAELEGAASGSHADLSLRTANGVLEHTVAVEWLPCHLGGTRPYFLCPDCASRRVVLFLRGYLACRACHGLYYESELYKDPFAATRKLERIVKKLGSSSWNVFPMRPRGMHMRTYERLKAEYQTALEGMAIGIGI